MSTSAIIMAGGEGSRLRPLTCETPKPMVPILGKPILSYTLQLLQKHHITDVGVTLQYLPNRITSVFGNKTREGLTLHYYHEKEPLGTAGGVLQAVKTMQNRSDTLLILSGDGLTDCDLTHAIQFHKQKHALATLVLKKVQAPLEYGVVLADDDGRVRRFVEKPGWGEVYSDTVNTGIYVLDPEALSYIPEGKPYDFGKDLFPLLVRENKDVFAFVSDAYWCDIGDQSAYVQAQADFLSGKIQLTHGPSIAETALIHETAVIDGPCYIGPGARIGAHSKISDYAVIGRNVSIGAHARVAGSILWDDVMIHDHAQARGAVLCTGAQVMQGASVHTDCALGDGAVLGPRASLEMSAKIWPGKRVDPFVRVTENLVWDGAPRPQMQAGAVEVTTPSAACQLSAAFAAAADTDRIALAHNGSADALSLYAAAISALTAQGVIPVLLGETIQPVLSFAQRALSIDAGIYIQGRTFMMRSPKGGLLSRAMQRKIEALLIRQDFQRPYAAKTALPLSYEEANALYVGALTGSFSSLQGALPHIAVVVKNEAHLPILAQVLRATAMPNRIIEKAEDIEKWETGFILSAAGDDVTVFDVHGIPDDAEQTLLSYACMPEDINPWIAKVDSSAMLESLAEKRNVEVNRVSASVELWADVLLQTDQRQYDMFFDGLYHMFSLCALLAKEKNTLRGILRSASIFCRHREKFACALPDRGQLLSSLAKHEHSVMLDGGLRIERENGWLTINPDDKEAEMLVIGEAVTMETAQELCGEILAKLHRYLKNN